MAKKKERGSSPSAAPKTFGKDLDFASVEAYNLLRTNLIFSLPDSEGGRVIGITSPCPEDGKSTTSLNLAYVLAESGARVILIDADMRRPSLAKMVDIPSVPGLSNYLVSENTDAVHSGDIHKNLSVMLSGEIPPNPSELIGSRKMQQFIEELREKYDYVILDLPPVNSVSDPLVVSKYVDGFVVVVRHKRTRRRDISEAIRQLELVDAKILGFVYNG